MSESKELVKRGEGPALPARPIHTIDALTTKIRDLQQSAHVLTPIAKVDSIRPLHGVSLRAAIINPAEDAGEVYVDKRFCDEKKGEVALGKNALAKLMAAAGVQVVRRRRLDDRSDPHYCEVEVTVAVQDFDGSWRQVIATKEVDLRDGAPETLKPEKVKKEGQRYPVKTGRMIPYDDSALADKRRHIQSLAETKALNRAIRQIFALKQKYTRAELRKPFVIPKLVADLDPSDPDQKAALMQSALNPTAALYGPGQAAHPADPPLSASEPAPALLSAGESISAEVVDAETGEVLEADVAAADPWDEPPAAALPELPISEETLSGATDERRGYLLRINQLYTDLENLIGSDAAGPIAQDLAAGVDWLGSDLTEIATVGRALRQEVERARGGAA